MDIANRWDELWLAGSNKKHYFNFIVLHYFLSAGAWSLGMGLGVSTIRGKLSKIMGKTEQGNIYIVLWNAVLWDYLICCLRMPRKL